MPFANPYFEEELHRYVESLESPGFLYYVSNVPTIVSNFLDRVRALPTVVGLDTSDMYFDRVHQFLSQKPADERASTEVLRHLAEEYYVSSRRRARKYARENFNRAWKRHHTAKAMLKEAQAVEKATRRKLRVWGMQWAHAAAEHAKAMEHDFLGGNDAGPASTVGTSEDIEVVAEPYCATSVLAASDDQETGNYMPPGQQVALGMEAKSSTSSGSDDIWYSGQSDNRQKRANTKCFYTYIFDIFAHMSLYEGQWTLDDYMRGVKDFNPDKVQRRSYLSGEDEGRNPPPSHLHPWIIRADEESNILRANPDRARVRGQVGDELLPISERTPNSLQRGDPVPVSFTVTYHVTAMSWSAQFHSADIVVLKAGDGDATNYTNAPALGLQSRPPPTLNAVTEENFDMEDGQYHETEGQGGESIVEASGMEGILVQPSGTSIGGEEGVQ
ncbi:hypothetical protein LXA43DRAFT_1067229 [Ganoderma leucocontextum]|nr:hypothetical protein LXA43DRAFT_1067229 [Ganoderma leucocontextum]